MKFDTELSLALRGFFEPLITNCVEDALRKASMNPTTPTAEPYGDFDWLKVTCSGVPASTLRGKSAAGHIPGLKKVGKRALYHKATVLNWLNEQTPPAKSTAQDVAQAAEEQFNAQLAKRNPA